MARPDDRIAALEAQMARLQARLDAAEAGRSGPPDPAIDRRTLFRRGGAALAGIAGAAAVPTVLAGSANAATGDPVIIGAANAASTTDAVTSLTAANPNQPVLSLVNTGNPGVGAPPVLRIGADAGFADTGVGDVGDLMVSDLTQTGVDGQGGAYLNFAHTGAGTGDTETLWGNVYTSRFASFIHLLPSPRRVLDTRANNGAKRGFGSVTAVNLGFNQAGPPPGLNGSFHGTPPQELVIGGLGVLGVLTAVAPNARGYLSAWPSGFRPNASSLNFTTVDIANFAIVGLSDLDSFYIFAAQVTHILFDVVGFIVADVGQVGPFDQTQALSLSATGARRAGGGGARRTGSLRQD